MAKIIYCEDDPSVQKLVRVALRSTPHEIRIVGDGAEALKLIERETPDVVFTDISMPGLDGIQLVKVLKSRPHLEHISIIVVTASAQRHQVEELHRYGIDGYIRKPFDVAELRAKVEEFTSTIR